MTWSQLDSNRPHLAYMILGGFTSLFMLVSLFVKERLYIGEATVATICGIIFGPHAANLFDPSTWGNVDQITLECSRIVLVVQCFAIGVELPKAYMERHWRSVTLLLLPVMTFGWLITSLFIWWLIKPLSWLEALCCAACVTATDPVLASSVVGKGKFAKRVPKHLRDLLSAESGCNDGMAFPFIYLALYLIRYRSNAGEVIFHWTVLTILYECVLGAIYGVFLGYAGRHAIKWAEAHRMIDRESFLVLYFVLALFCAGSASFLGMDDLLVGFAAGVGFSNDGWFQAKTEESHVSNVIDLLLNLAYFVYFGSIIPWASFNMPELGITPWRLIVIAILVVLFRRIPIMLALKPIIPDMKTWREALFAGHFGPIGVGAIFVAILARAELETDSTTPLAEVPTDDKTKNYILITLIWPIVSFLVMASILVHGSSIAVFTLGKRINTLSITMSYTEGNENGPSWMNRLPRIQTSASRNSMSSRKSGVEEDSSNEQLPKYPPGFLPPVGLPRDFLRRQKEEESNGSRPTSVRGHGKRRKWDSGMGPGGPISLSAIAPQRRPELTSPTESLSADTLAERSDDSLKVEVKHPINAEPVKGTMYEEGNDIIIEDEDGNVIRQDKLVLGGKHAENAQKMKDKIKNDLEHPAHAYGNIVRKVKDWNWKGNAQAGPSNSKKPEERKRGPGLAYHIGDTIIIEDADGEVVKKIDVSVPKLERRPSAVPSDNARRPLQRMGTWLGIAKKDKEEDIEAGPVEEMVEKDDGIRYTMGDGRRMTQADLMKQMQSIDPRQRARAVEETDAPDHIKDHVKKKAREEQAELSASKEISPTIPGMYRAESSQISGSGELNKIESVQDREIPTYFSLTDDIRRNSNMGRQTAAQRRRFEAKSHQEDDSDDDGTERVPPGRRHPSPPHSSSDETPAERRRREAAFEGNRQSSMPGADLIHSWQTSRQPSENHGETAVERRRREAALGTSNDRRQAGESSSGRGDRSGHTDETPAERRRREAALRNVHSDSDNGDDESAPPPIPRHSGTSSLQAAGALPRRSIGIRFADQPSIGSDRHRSAFGSTRRGRG
ncbi:MAG: hypothetical protein M1829_005921 [Trizodia sp. TS-e1964]|nr:MAG: hypothetical protein M1829_005921 [Trizodia sp. TS-e1964]